MILSLVLLGIILIQGFLFFKVCRDHSRVVDTIHNTCANRVERERDAARREREELVNRLVALTDLEAAATTIAEDGEKFEVTYVGNEHEGRGGYLNGQANERT